MAFETLSERLQQAFKNLTGKGKLSENDIKSAMREVKLALLEADVNFKIVKEFVARVSEKSKGAEIGAALNPSQQVIKIVHEELIELMGSSEAKLSVSDRSPTVYMLVGLQGAGKTTAIGKLASHLRKKGKRPLMVACDIYRPAAIKQLQVLGKSLDMPVFEMGDQISPVEISKKAVEHAQKYMNDVVLIDTAGRLHIDEALMNELEDIKTEIKPQEILLVLDSMTGQDAVSVAKTFDESLNVDGIILTKLDGDTRGGAALSVREVTGKPIKFASVGEKLSDLEVFHPDRMASRILGMGDILSLIEKAQENLDEKEAIEMAKKIKRSEFDLNDFLSQLQQMKKMGSIKDILKMIPGMNNAALKDINVDEKQFVRTEAIIQSMTLKERKNPKLLNASRRKRIAMGSGTEVSDINRLVKQFEDMQKMMKKFTKKSGRKGGNPFSGMNLPF